jgi:hypothetical protein
VSKGQYIQVQLSPGTYEIPTKAQKILVKSGRNQEEKNEGLKERKKKERFKPRNIHTSNRFARWYTWVPKIPI